MNGGQDVVKPHLTAAIKKKKNPIPNLSAYWLAFAHMS